MPGGHRVTTGLREREGLAGQQSLPQCRDIFWGALEGMVGAEKLVLGKKKKYGHPVFTLPFVIPTVAHL